jgi:hypothetical protein
LREQSPVVTVFAALGAVGMKLTRNGVKRQSNDRLGHQPGFQIVQLFGLMAISLMISALAIDFSYYYTAFNAIHTAADSAALAAASELYRDRQPNPKVRLNDARMQAQQYLYHNQPNIALGNNDLVFGFVNPSGKRYNRVTFATPTANPDFAYSDGYNGVWVRVSKSTDSVNRPLNTIMGNLFGVHQMNIQATAVAMVDQSVNAITNGGVRPIYICEAQLNQAMRDGIPENNVVRVFADHVALDGEESTSGCPQRGSGSWSFADFTGCGVSNVGAGTIQSWFSGGYRGAIHTEQCYGARPGDFITTLGESMNSLIARGKVFPVPLYQEWSGSGNRANVTVSGFVGFKPTRFVNTGPVSERFIEGHFQRYLCNKGCGSSGATVTRPAGSVVKIRLASRS